MYSVLARRNLRESVGLHKGHRRVYACRHTTQHTRCQINNKLRKGCKQHAFQECEGLRSSVTSRLRPGTRHERLGEARCGVEENGEGEPWETTRDCCGLRPSMFFYHAHALPSVSKHKYTAPRCTPLLCTKSMLPTQNNSSVLIAESGAKGHSQA